MSDLSYLPDFVLVVLAAWLGATVLARRRRAPASGLFAGLSLAVATWAAAWTVERLSTSHETQVIAGSLTSLAGALLPALLVHMVLALSTRPWSRFQGVVIVTAYVVAAVFGGLSAVAEENRAFGPSVHILGVPGPVLDWAWVAFRLGIMALAAWWIWSEQAGRGQERPQPQLLAMFGAVSFGAVGGGMSILMDQVGGPAWPGTALLAIAFIFAAYATFRGGLFFAPDAARRILSYSLSGAALVALIALGVSALDDVARRTLGFDSPMPIALILVVTLAFFDRFRDRLRNLFSPGTADTGYRRMMVALGGSGVDAIPEDRWEGVVRELSKAIGGSEIRLVDDQGRHRAGGPAAAREEDPQLDILLDGGGQLLIGPKPNALPYTPTEWDLMRQAAHFIESSMALAHQTTQQVTALAGLGQLQERVRSEEAELSVSLTAPATGVAGLDVYLLGTLHAERGGQPVRSWGGEKAGSRQAEAVFAFLLDRGERGVLKDEFLELIWPDVEMERADVAFHRTLLGLRGMLAGNADLPRQDVITFHNDRYRLNPKVVHWTDVADFEQRLLDARGAEEEEMIRLLEAARRLYRGDYLDDCPYYGDSSDVEERRQDLRGRFTDVVLTLAGIHERRGDRAAAAGYYRDALAANGQECPPAREGLLRLEMTP